MKLARRVTVLFFLAVLDASAAPADAPCLVAVLVDTSGSVGAPGIASAEPLVEGVLDALPPGSEVAVFRFDDQATLVLPRTSRREDVRRALAGLRPAGRHTALYDALYDAGRYVADVPDRRAALLLLTDGRDEDSAVDLDDGLRLAEGLRLPVFTIGVGRVDEKRLRRIAKLTGGTYAPIESARAAGLAARLAAAAAPPKATAPAATPAGATPTAAPSKPAPPVSAPARPEPAPAAASSRPVTASLVLLVLVALGVVAALLAARRGRAARCTQCGRPLAHPLAACASCDFATGDRERTRPSDVSPTIVARLDAAEETLDKTVILSDRALLTVTKGGAPGRVFELGRETSTSIGRARANDVVLDDVAVSSQHCRIRPEDGQYVVHDLQSTNGTFVNDRRVARHPLSEGDVIQVGETWLTFRREQRRG